jgi:ribonucleoside-diphosphate reductase alpha chain
MIAGASGGVEPIFALAFIRNIMDGAELLEVHPFLEKIAKEKNFYSEEVMKQISYHGSVIGVEGVPEEVQNVYVTSHDVSPEWHVKMQAAFQLHTDNAVSKTVNFCEDATREQIAQTYILAYESKLKGTTVYRNNSRFGQAMIIKATDTRTEETASGVEAGSVTPRERPVLTYGVTDKIQTGCGALYVTINVDEEGLCEVFARMGKSGGCATSQAEATGRMISLSLRAGVEVDAIINQLKGIRCPSPAMAKGGMILSCSDAIAKVLERNLEKLKGLGINTKDTVQKAEKAYGQDNSSKADAGHCPECPECGQMLEFGEGCVICKNCGYSKCS